MWGHAWQQDASNRIIFDGDLARFSALHTVMEMVRDMRYVGSSFRVEIGLPLPCIAMAEH